MTLSDFDYHLPPEKIAQVPLNPRDTSKLLIVDRATGMFTDKHFFDFADLLTPNDVLVLNNTKVFPARLLVHKTLQSTQTGQRPVSTKAVELLLEKEVGVSAETITWDALTKPGLKAGDIFEIPGSHVRGVCEAVNNYTRRITFFTGREHFLSQLDRWAKTPIPPYIRWNSDDEAHLREVYQTVYAKYQGAVAAPTAGLHFTPALLEKIKAKGIQIEEVTLHVGLGTFLPVKTEHIEDHYMHAEWFELSEPVAERLNAAKKNGKRIIAVGTTTVRVLETCAVRALDVGPLTLGNSSQMPNAYRLKPNTSVTSIFIFPPYQFKFVDSILTNFHTPKSTLLMLISAFVSSPNTPILLDIDHWKLDVSPCPAFTTFEKSLVGEAYGHALSSKYRFYSFGDAMWIR